MNAITIKQASTNLDQLIAQVINDVQPIVLCDDLGNQAVLMPLEEFNAWQETLYLLSNPVNAKRLLSAIDKAESGLATEHQLIEDGD
jgi:antitoxin YefM